MATGQPIFTAQEIARYARQIRLKALGGAGQQRLKHGRVLVAGVGGVGGPAALYLAAAGVGRLTLVDPDHVGLSNLHRQIQFRTTDLGRGKAESTAEALAALNPHIDIVARPEAITAEAVDALVRDHDLVVDGVDSFETRLLVSDACVRAAVPLVASAIGAWDAQIGLFDARPCWRCFVTEPPPLAEPCDAVGVLGPMAGLAGSAAALFALRRLAGVDQPDPGSGAGRLLMIDGLALSARVARVIADPRCPACGEDR